MESINILLKEYRNCPQRRVGIRLGQYFCNKYIKGQWPQLYYCECEYKSTNMIRQWLIDNCYETSLPTELK